MKGRGADEELSDLACRATLEYPRTACATDINAGSSSVMELNSRFWLRAGHCVVLRTAH